MIAMLRLEAIGDDETWVPRTTRAILRRIAELPAPERQRAAKRIPEAWWPTLTWRMRRPWVARLLGRDPRFGYRRDFLRPKTDYRDARGAGCRGVALWFVLSEGAPYEVHELVSERRTRRRFVTVREGRVVEIEREEVDRWLGLQ